AAVPGATGTARSTMRSTGSPAHGDDRCGAVAVVGGAGRRGRGARMSVEMLVGVLIAWAAGKASRVGGRLDQLTDEALDHGVERVRALALGRVGADTAVRRLLEEARETEGEVSNRTRHEAAEAIEDAAARDDVLAAALREASGARPMREPWKEAQVNKGVQGIYASGSGNVNIKNRVVDKVVNQYH